MSGRPTVEKRGLAPSVSSQIVSKRTDARCLSPFFDTLLVEQNVQKN